MLYKNYYCLVSGLREYALDSDSKGFDAAQIISEIKEGLSRKDVRQVELLYGFQDIGNIVSIAEGGSSFSSLGNLTRETIERELARPASLPGYILSVLRSRAEAQEEAGHAVELPPLSRQLYEAYYAECEARGCRFLKEWSAFDRTVRNLTAAVTARARGMQTSEFVVGNDDITQAIGRSAAADFGLKGDVEYTDYLLSALSPECDMLEKERRIDLLRWSKAEELATFDYFNINGILSYLVRVNLVHRWSVLNEKTGRELFRRLVDSFGEAGRRGGESFSSDRK